MGHLRDGLAPFVDREVMAKAKARAVSFETIKRFADDPMLADKPIADWDAAGLLKLMWDTWNDVFRNVLGFAERSLVSELRDWRNKWAHQRALLQRRHGSRPRLRRTAPYGCLGATGRIRRPDEDGTAPLGVRGAGANREAA